MLGICKDCPEQKYYRDRPGLCGSARRSRGRRRRRFDGLLRCHGTFHFITGISKMLCDLLLKATTKTST